MSHPKAGRKTDRADHMAESVEWYTPIEIVDAARAVLGAFDLDPASCVEANAIVRAGQIYTREDDGLARPWYGRVFLNPPGGLVREFWGKLIDDYASGHVTEAIWIGFTVQQLQTLQRVPGKSPILWPICVPDHRLKFRRPAGIAGEDRPGHANFIVYLGVDVEIFADVFGEFGAVRI